jgi:hypothetical protein
MKINCGKSWETRFDESQQWHSWFAWRPVRVADNDCRWLEEVERKRVVYTCPGAMIMEWKYRRLDIPSQITPDVAGS